MDEALAFRHQPGQAEAAGQITRLLNGGVLLTPGVARRLQDPLSLRNIAQVHGAALAAIRWAAEAAEAECNGASDSPGVTEDGRVLSHGGFLTPHLTVTLSAMNHALAHVAALSTARIGKLLSPRFTDLPRGLSAVGAEGAGLAPVLKSAEALSAEIAHLAAPPPVYPSAAADGVEDAVTHSAIPAKAAHRILDALDRLVAIEMIVAAQAVDLRGARLGADLAAVHADVRRISAPMTADRPLSAEIEALALKLRGIRPPLMP